ncbi:MAG: type I methionyl aminopeptidase [Anaerolineae bacterium]|nr:type I methionyl aminopeptidase [Anaerolineae bacterium]
MTVESEQDIEALKRIGRIVALTLREMAAHVRAGVTTAELDAVARRFMAQHGARSGPVLVYNFPGATCISVNDEAAHGIPGARVIRPGDLVNLDCTGELDGYMADAAIMVGVPPVSPEAQRLLDCAQAALDRAIGAARAGRRIYEIGAAIEAEAQARGFKVLRELTGHGVGRSVHEEPAVPNYRNRRFRQRLHDGLVLAIEPHVAAGEGSIVEDADGWTLRTRDGALSAVYEHTVVIQGDRPLVLTAL